MIYLFLLIIGVCVGSFLNVLIDRLPRNESILGRSHCESCRKTLTWKDLIPVLSFVSLKGKCRYCSSRLSFQYPVVEFITGILFVITYVHVMSGGIFNFQFSPLLQSFAGQAIFNEFLILKSLIINLVYSLFIVSTLIVVFLADLKYGIIPDKIILPSLIVSFIFLIINHQSSIINNLLSAIGAFLFFLLIYALTRGRGMGLGDVKFSLVLGLALGISGTILALYIAFLTGGILGIILILWRKKGLKYAIPFGPFLALGFLISFFFSREIVGYLQGALGSLLLNF